MKSTSRLRQKTNGKHAVLQGKNDNHKAAAAALPTEPNIKDGAYSSNEPVCLTIFDIKTDGFIAGLDITAAQLNALRQASAESGRPLCDLLRDALDHVTSAANKLPFFTITDELEASRVQSSALHFLLADAMAGKEDGRYGEEIDWGIRELAMQTDGRLKRAIEAATANRGEVVS